MLKLKENNDWGLLIIRVGVGAMFLFVHGLPKLMGGPEMWGKVGGAMGHFGITFFPEAWGLMAALSEGLGGLLLILGVGTRSAAIFMAFTMLIAASHHLISGDPIGKAAYPISIGFVFLALVFLGSGKYALRPSR